ncbi:MAG TPA: hypothetical protein DCL61_28690 [Cyanobacteria bacterium UBA12227]|nr:hypothetical protein [Cyanobacteria bacterium UBA12227]HAX89029.1 hypothetical protein [Cyanobacteria bacterium UBA11370]HBY77626.1 hypothetical protein [Cyanobacteria bacterium UBA11148]
MGREGVGRWGDGEMGRWGDGEESKQPTTNNQQPTTNNQQPTTNNQPTEIATDRFGSTPLER